MSLGPHLRALRVAEPYETLREAGAALGVGMVALSKIEAGIAHPAYDLVHLAAAHYGVGDAERTQLVDEWALWKPRPADASPFDGPPAFICGRPS